MKKILVVDDSALMRRVLCDIIEQDKNLKVVDKATNGLEAFELIKKNSRHYAKRQYTWFNNQMNVNWFDVDFDNFSNTINEVYEYIEKEQSDK